MLVQAPSTARSARRGNNGRMDMRMQTSFVFAHPKQRDGPFGIVRGQSNRYSLSCCIRFRIMNGTLAKVTIENVVAHILTATTVHNDS